jgi:hypothetical protein
MPILVELDLLLVSFLIPYDMCNCISLVMEAMFWCNVFDITIKLTLIQ